MGIGQALRWLWPAPDRRSCEEIEHDIAAEIEFHIAQAADELVAAGADPSAARAEALRRFGDLDRVRAACRRAQMGERIMLLRLQWIVITLLGAAVGFLVFENAAARERLAFEREQAIAARTQADQASQTARAAEERLQSVAATQPDQERADARAAVATSPADDPHLIAQATLTACNQSQNWSPINALVLKHGPVIAAAILREIYADLPVQVREQCFKAFWFDGGTPVTLSVLDLGARDPEASVRGRAFYYLRSYGFRDFSEDQTSYERWYERYGKEPLVCVLCDNAVEWANRVADLTGEALLREMRTVERFDPRIAEKAGADLGAALEGAGFLQRMSDWLTNGDPQVAKFALHAASWLKLDQDRLRAEILAPLELNPARENEEVLAEYCALIGVRGNSWAVTPLLQLMQRHLNTTGEHHTFSMTMALGNINDPSVIPQLIDLLAVDDSTDQRYSIGYFALGPMTGVVHDPTHGAAWWRDWWAQNRARFGR